MIFLRLHKTYKKMEEALSKSIILYVLIILGVVALVTLVFLLFQIGKKIKTHLDTQQTQQDRLNQSTVANFENIKQVIDPILKFVASTENFIKHSKEDSQQLRQYAMDHKLQMERITDMYEKSLNKIILVEEKVAVIDEKVNKITSDCKERHNGKI